jgi:catechol 2,3-dioxygenase-like lactoylglutathione lyase family enzyme
VSDGPDATDGPAGAGEIPGPAHPADEETAGAGRPLSTVVELFVADVERSIAFYGLLGFRVAQRWQDWIRMRRDDGAGIVLFSDQYIRNKPARAPHYFGPYIDREPRGVGVEIVVQVSDVRALYQRLIGAAVPIVKELQDRPWGTTDFRVADPDGYFIRLTSPLGHD